MKFLRTLLTLSIYRKYHTFFLGKAQKGHLAFEAGFESSNLGTIRDMYVYDISYTYYILILCSIH